MNSRPLARLGITALTVAVLGTSMAPSALAAAPGAPSGFQGYGTPDGVHLSWTPGDITDLASYQIRYWVGTSAPTSVDEGTVAPPVDSFSTETVITSLVHTTTYAFSLFACDAELACSGPVSTTVATPTTDYPNVLNDSSTGTTATMSWTYPPGALSYRLTAIPETADTQYPATPTDEGFAWVEVSASPATLTGLTASTDYAVALFPMLANGGWGTMGLGSVTTGVPVPNSPTAAVAQTRPFGVNIAWSAPASGPAVTTYHVRYAVTTPPATMSAGTGGPYETGTNVTLSGGLTSGTTYGFSVFACNSQLVCSAPATTTFLAKANEIPAVSVSGQTDTSAVVAWSTLSGTSGYRIGRGADDAELPTTPADPDFVWADDSAPPYTLTGLSPSVGYSVVVVPMYADGGWGAYGVSGFSTTAPPPPPATGLSAVLSSAGTVTLNWSSASSPSGGWSIVGHNGATDTISLPCPNTTGVCFNLGGAGGSARTFTITSAQIGNGQGSKWFFGVTPMTSEGVRGTTAKVAVVPWSAAKLAPLYIGSTPSYSGGVYKMNLQWENPPQPNWTHIKVFIAAGTTAPSDSGTPVYSCVRSTGCVKSKLVSALANGTKLVNGAKYSFSAYAYVSPTSPQQKARAFGTDTARATGVVINGAWVTNSLPPHYYGEVELAFDSTGKQHLVYPRETGLYYASKPAGGAWTSSVKIPGTSGSDNYAELTVLSNNTLVLGFNRFGAGPYLLTKTSAGAWSAASRIGATTPASGTSAYVFQNLVRDSANGLHVLISRSSYPAKSTDGLFYLKRVSGGAWSAVTKIPGTTGYDYGLLSIDSSRTKLGLAFGRSGHPTASSNGAFAAVKAPAAANFPTPARIASNVTNTEFYPTGMTIHGTRVQVFLDRSAYPAQATDGVYLRKGLLGGTAAAPTVNWGAAAAARVAGTTAADFMCGVAVNPANGEMTMCLDRDGAASISGLYLLKSTTAGVWGGTAAVKKTAADYDYVTDVDYYANAVYFTWLRH